MVLMAVAFVILPAAVLIALAVRAYRRGDALADGWARQRSLELCQENRPMVVRYLSTSRALRRLGVLVGLMAIPLVALALGDPSFGGGLSWFAVLAGYLVGTICAEVVLRRPTGPRGRRASVRRRELRDYLSPWAWRSQRRTAAIAGLLTGAAVVVPVRDPSMVPLGARVATLVAVGVALVGVEAVQRWLIRRPQPVVSPPLLAADEAIRVQSVHSIAGAAMGLQWLLAGLGMWALAVSDVQVLRWAMWAPAIASVVIAFVSCTRYDHGGFQIRQPVGP